MASSCSSLVVHAPAICKIKYRKSYSLPPPGLGQCDDFYCSKKNNRHTAYPQCVQGSIESLEVRRWAGFMTHSLTLSLPFHFYERPSHRLSVPGSPYVGGSPPLCMCHVSCFSPSETASLWCVEECYSAILSLCGYSCSLLTLSVTRFNN